jgi:hypothetical protein
MSGLQLQQTVRDFAIKLMHRQQINGQWLMYAC